MREPMTLVEAKKPDSEQSYYDALFQRDYREAKRLYRLLSISDTWKPDRVIREAHKCGIYDEADRDDEPIRLAAAPPSPRLDVAKQLTPLPLA